MRARLARPRHLLRGRLVAPVAVAAAAALVGGVVVATPDAPTVRSEVQSVANEVEAGKAGAEFSFDLAEFFVGGEWDGIEITEIKEVTGLPDGLEHSGGVISGTAAQGSYNIHVTGQDGTVVPVTLVVDGEDGSAPAGVEGGSTGAIQGSLGGEAQAGGEAEAGGQAGAGGEAGAGGQAEAGGQITTGSDGTDAILGAVVGIVTSLGGDSGSAAELVTGSTGGGDVTPENLDAPDTPASPLGSLATGQVDMGSLGGGNVTPENPDSPDAPSGSETPGSDSTVTGETGGEVDAEVGAEVGGDATAGVDTQSAGPLGSLVGSPTTETGSTGEGETTGGGEVTVPGSSTSASTGSLGGLAPGLAITGAALLGLAGLSLVLNGGSSTPGSTAMLPALPGSSGSTSVKPTVAAGAPAPTKAPGPTVANGRG